MTTQTTLPVTSPTTTLPTTSQPPPKTLLNPPKHQHKPSTQAGQTSWADRVRVSSSNTRFTLDPLPRQPVGQCLKITEQILLENTAQWTRCMIGFFPGFKMPYHAVNAIASRVWRQCGLENVMTTANGFMIFRFKTEEEMHAVMEKGPWMFGGKNIILQQWHPRYNFDKSKISTLPVWIRLHGLPFPLWSKQGLSLAASMVGRPLSCDELTYNCTRLEYARLCVEIDASLPVINSFDIECPLSADPITVTVDYEWKPKHCEQCKVFGHTCKFTDDAPQFKVLQTTSPTSPTKPPTTNHSTTPIASPVPPTPLTTTLPSTNIPKLPTYNNNHSIHPYLYRSHLQFTYQELKHATPVKIQYLSNTSSSPTCRILVGWNPHKLHLIPLHFSSQWLTCEVNQPNQPIPTRITFVYGHNTPAERQALWEYIAQESGTNGCTPWLVMGDFNAIMQASDRYGGDTQWPCYQDDFSTCINHSELIQVPYTGIKYSWNNGQHGANLIQKKLDWIFGNPLLFSTWPATQATFQPRSISDHSAMILSFNRPNHHRHSSFKFLNAWADRNDFPSIVASSWCIPITGNPMFKLTSKLRRLKPALRQLHFQHTNNITSRVAQAKASWDAAQYDIDNHPESEEAKVNERHLAAAYMQLCKDEESYFKQKSRIQWLQLGDRNTSFFHKSLLHRQVRNNIYRLQDDAGTVIHDQQEIGNMASTYFQRLLCVPNPPILEDLHSIYPATISEASKSIAEAPITNDDIQAALFSIPDTKAPGPDGYNAFFFKKCWDIIKVDFTAAIRYFFLYNTLPRCVNATRRLIDTHQLRTLTATGLPWNAKVSNIITDGHWQFPMETTSLHAQWNSINFHPKPFHDDQWVWTGQPSGKFTIHSAWELLRDRRPLNTLHLLLWFKGHIPRQSFILWLASMGRLHTMDRLQMAGIISNASCILCGLHTETHGHLFFECPTSQLVWQTVNAKANIYWPCCTWQNLLQWGTTHYSRKKDIQHLIARLVLSASVYILWHERNKRVFNHQYQSAANIAEEVFQQVRTQITTMEFRGTIPAAICNIWGIMDDRNTA
uniref:Reverse transcriptase zinc-binding domain-containing protein n=1 Tax=Populus alba TaxID=43335 RepID=A0A4U5NQH5_POPAL|nr:hypothetical protein D5086_0000251720 [Populus alba]